MKCAGCGIERQQATTPCSICGHTPAPPAPAATPQASTAVPAAPAAPVAPQPTTVTIEKTGKKWKKMKLLSALVLLCGIGGCVGSGMIESTGGAVFFTLVALVGIGMRYYARIGIWWHHG